MPTAATHRAHPSDPVRSIMAEVVATVKPGSLLLEVAAELVSCGPATAGRDRALARQFTHPLAVLLLAAAVLAEVARPAPRSLPPRCGR
jgi:hypothetical protein